MKYKLDFEKYRKSDVEKYKNISKKILQSERADLIDMSPDFDFCMNPPLLQTTQNIWPAKPRHQGGKAIAQLKMQSPH